MKMDFEQFQQNAGSDPQLPASDAGGEAEESAETEAETRPDPLTSKPTMSVDMGPDGTSVSVDAPLNDMDPQEAISLAQEVQGPSMGEELKEVLLDPTVQDILRDVWYGPDDPQPTSNARAETTTMDPTEELDREELTAETDGGTEELSEDNIYRITPEGLVAILQQQVGEVAALKPEMSLEELDQFMAANEDRLVGEAEELLEAMDQ